MSYSTFAKAPADEGGTGDDPIFILIVILILIELGTGTNPVVGNPPSPLAMLQRLRPGNGFVGQVGELGKCAVESLTLIFVLVI